MVTEIEKSEVDLKFPFRVTAIGDMSSGKEGCQKIGLKSFRVLTCTIQSSTLRELCFKDGSLTFCILVDLDNLYRRMMMKMTKLSITQLIFKLVPPYLT